MKYLTLILASFMCFSQLHAAGIKGEELVGTYKFHLYFGDSAPFEDQLVLKLGDDGKLQGSMHVPNDFDADLQGIEAEETELGITKLSFYVQLPEKYHHSFGERLFYELKFLYRSPFTVQYQNQFVGFVTHHKQMYRPTYVGSVVGFKQLSKRSANSL